MDDLVQSLIAWAEMVESGYEVPAAGPVIRRGAQVIKEQSDRIAALTDRLAQVKNQLEETQSQEQLAVAQMLAVMAKLRDARIFARREALEEAARVADSSKGAYDTLADAFRVSIAREIAVAIRALKEK